MSRAVTLSTRPGCLQTGIAAPRCKPVSIRSAKVQGLHQTASDIAASGSFERLDASAVVDALNAVATPEALHSFSAGFFGNLAGTGTLHNIEDLPVGSIVHTIAPIADAVSSTPQALAHAVPHADAAGAVQHAAEAPSLMNMALATLPSASDVLSAVNQNDVAAVFNDLGFALGQRLSSLQHLDPSAFDSLVNSLSVVLDAVDDALHAEAVTAAQSSVTMLSVSLQHLTDVIGSQPASAAFVDSAAQTAAAAASTDNVGLDGLLKMVVGAVALIMASVPSKGYMEQDDESNEAELPSRYDPDEVKDYFSRRPVAVMRRQAEVASKLSAFLAALLADWRTGQWLQNMPKRAVWLRTIFESLGPAYVKIAQALSTRVDMLPDPYLREFAKLQDSVPTFPTTVARATIEEDLGMPIDDMFDEFSEQPVASASLGQVYKARLKPQFGGAEVAVKVQRPGIMEGIALDTLLMRKATEIVSSVPQFYSSGWSEVLDDWAGRFFQEMDYKLEAYNTITFKRHMASLENIVVADIYPELTSRRVIVSGWVVGEKLSNCKTEEVLPLCDALLNCYLIQLLDTGFLHADPHPGNLLRTPDGKICILDFGLMSEVDPDQRIYLVEYITHLSLEDWDGVCNDLVALGFLPPTMSEENLALIQPVIKEVMGQLVMGGTGSISIGSLSLQLEGVARQYKMVIPPYFALVLRAFSVIEGIAMQHDPDYAIVASCFPYLSRRLLTDNHPRMRAALKQLLYGTNERLDVARLATLMNAFSSFTVGTQDRLTQGPTFSDAANFEDRVKTTKEDWDAVVVDDALKEVLLVIFSKEGSYAQELIVEELVASVDALSREAVGEALRMVLASNAAVTALRSMEALGPMRAMILPMPLPIGTLTSMGARVKLTDDDRQALDTISMLLDVMGGGMQPGSHMHMHTPSRPFDLSSFITSADHTFRASSKLVRGAGDLLPLMPELLPGMQTTAEMFVSRLVRRMALRLADDLAPRSGTAL